MKSPAIESTSVTNPHVFTENATLHIIERTHFWQRVALMGVLLLTVVLRFFRIDQQGYGNLYYAAGIQSMLRTWHNFFFVAFDSQGFLAIDKPPLGLWIQAGSVWLFGWHGWSLFVPQALAGTFSVGVLFFLVRRYFGVNAGLFAALILALTPIAVATDRNNTMDSLLVFVLLVAAVCIGVAAEQGNVRLLLLGAVVIGIGFNIKMLQAFLPLPAFCVWYLAAAPRQWRRRSIHLLVAFGVVMLVSLPWILAVDMTPASERPFVASSSNSEFDLVLGHNGGARVMQNPFHASTPLTAYVTDEIGFPGPLRMWQRQLGGQVSWLLPLALFGLVVAFWKPLGSDALRSRSTVLMWGTWLLLALLFFSIGRKFHRYYLVMLGPPIAALAGIAIIALWKYYRANGWRVWLLPGALLGTALAQMMILFAFSGWEHLLGILVMGISLIIASILLILHYYGLKRRAHGVVIAGVAYLLLAPAVWSMTPLWGAHPSQPYAGPELLDAFMPSHPSDHTGLLRYLREHQGGEPFLAATITAASAAPMILQSGSAVMAVGGYSGGDDIVTPDQFATRIAAKEVRFVVLPTRTNQQPELVAWVATHCTVVEPRLWHTGAPVSQDDALNDLYTLFDCKP